MSLLVTGSIGIDTVKTPRGVSENCLGGSSVYFSMAASFFSPVRVVGGIGADCPVDLAKIFAGRDVDLTGLEIRAQSKTFRWTGSYQEDMDSRTTDCVELNVLAEAPPAVPEQFRDSEFVFLANTAPALQRQLLEQMKSPEFVAVDTMNLWIEGELDPSELATLAGTACLVDIEQRPLILFKSDFWLRQAIERFSESKFVAAVQPGRRGGKA